MKNDKFILNKSSKFIIYGASYVGVKFYNMLKHGNYETLCFFDKSAEQIKTKTEMPIYHPDEFSRDDKDKDNKIVIVAVTSIFEHENIAEYLYSLGYLNILCKSASIGYDMMFEQKNMNRIYDDLLDGKELTDNLELNKYTPFCKSNELPKWFKDKALIRTDEAYTIAYVPMEILFTSKELGNYELEGVTFDCSDKSIFTLLPFINLFDFFEGCGECKLEHYLAFSSKARGGYSNTIDLDQLNRVIHERQVIHSQMTLALEIDSDFFIENPPLIEWNEGGYFNINDGLHRVSFFMRKNITKIPCKMKTEDYERWANKDALSDCVEFITNKRISKVYTPVPNPYFYLFPSLRENGGQTRLAKICQVLSEKNIDITGKKVLDAGSYISYFAQHFSRMGATVTSVEFNEESFELASNLNKLLCCNNIEMINDGIENIDEKNKFDITNMLTLLYWHLDSDLGLKILNKIDAVTKDIMLWESGYEIEREIDFILDNSNFKRYEKICQTFGTGKMRELGIFYK